MPAENSEGKRGNYFSSPTELDRIKLLPSGFNYSV